MIALGQFSRELMAALPGELWTALGALAVWALTTLTARISNSHARKLLTAQLQHDSTERQREREHAIKRDVFLPALKAGSQSTVILGRFCEPDVDVRTLNSELQTVYTKLAAAASLASVEAWTSVAKFQQAIGALQFELAAARGPVNLAHLNLQYVRKQASIALREQEELNAELRRSDGKNGAEPAERARVERAFRAAQTLFEDMQARGATLEKELNAAMLGPFSLLCDRLPSIAESGLACITAMRTELGLPTDVAALVAAQQAMILETKSAMEALRARVEAELSAGAPAS